MPKNFAARLFTVVFLTAGACSAAAKPAGESSVSGTIMHYGVYREYGEVHSRRAQTAATGTTSEFEDFEHLETTTEVPLKLGTIFGFEYEMRGLRAALHDTVTIRALHPAIRGVDGKTYTESTVAVDIEPQEGTWRNYLVYRLSDKREVVAGRWVLQILYEGKPVVSKEFTVK